MHDDHNMKEIVKKQNLMDEELKYILNDLKGTHPQRKQIDTTN